MDEAKLEAIDWALYTNDEESTELLDVKLCKGTTSLSLLVESTLDCNDKTSSPSEIFGEETAFLLVPIFWLNSDSILSRVITMKPMQPEC